MVACTLRGLRQLGEIATLDCQPLNLPLAQVHLDVPTRFARHNGLRNGSVVYLEIDPQGIHIMPMRRALQDPSP